MQISRALEVSQKTIGSYRLWFVLFYRYSDHHLVIAKIKLRPRRVEKKANRLKKYNTAKLKVPEVALKFKIELRHRFSCLADDDHTQVQDLENDWKKIKETYQGAAEKVLGFRSRSNKPWISADSSKKIDDRIYLKRKMDSIRSEGLGNSLETLMFSQKQKGEETTEERQE